MIPDVVDFVLNHLLNSGFTGEIFYYGDTKNNPWK